jgi:hypothetical protein
MEVRADHSVQPNSPNLYQSPQDLPLSTFIGKPVGRPSSLRCGPGVLKVLSGQLVD